MPTLANRLQQHKRTAQFNNLVYTAFAEREPLDDVNVITLKGEYARKVEALAIDRVTSSRKRLTRANVMKEMDKIFGQTDILVQEAVYFKDNGIFVVVDCDAVDDVATMRALELVQEALDQLGTKRGKVKFGKPVSFCKVDIPWLNLH